MITESPACRVPSTAPVAAMPVANAKECRAPSSAARVVSASVRVGFDPRWYSKGPSPPSVGCRNVEAVWIGGTTAPRATSCSAWMVRVVKPAKSSSVVSSQRGQVYTDRRAGASLLRRKS